MLSKSVVNLHFYIPIFNDNHLIINRIWINIKHLGTNISDDVIILIFYSAEVDDIIHNTLITKDIRTRDTCH